MTEVVYVAVVVNAFITMGVVVKEYFRYKAKKNGKSDADKLIQDAVKKQMGFNPHSPGESNICRENRDKIIKNEEAIENVEKSLERIERKLNGLK